MNPAPIDAPGNLQDGLDRAARHVREAHKMAGGAQVLAATAHRAEDPPATMAEVTELARLSGEASATALRLLIALGAARPGPAVATDALRLDQLDTPASRRLLSALEAAAEAGAALDRERGWVDADGDPIGHGEHLGGLVLAMRTEIYGPKGGE